MRVLVTGGTGYPGAAIVRALRQSGHDPAVFARRAGQRAPRGGAAIDGDIRDAGAVAGAVRATDATLHAAALVGVWRRRPREFDDLNVGGTAHVLPGLPPVMGSWSFAWLDDVAAACTLGIFGDDRSLDSGPAIRELGYGIRPLDSGIQQILASAER